MRSVWRALPALSLLFAAQATWADERISRYLSDVQVEKDGALDVTETIDIRAENDRIRHGIYRDFPTRYTDNHGVPVRVGFAFEGATLDGAPATATTEPFANGIRIKVGDASSLVSVGEHTYVLRYRTTRQLGRFKDYDELYWNATGNGWIFPIDEADARIRLPQPVKFGQRAVYTGPQGSTAANATIVDEKPGDILFQTTQPLGPNEGLTVAVAFPKGVVGNPAGSQRAAWWLSDYGPPLLGLFALIGLCFFYYIAWQRAGRDPRAGTVVPIFTPPDDLSPPGMRYVVKMKSDNRSFAAALVDMGVLGHLKITDEDRGWLSGKTRIIERLYSTNPLPSEEADALDELGSTGEQVEMKQKNYQIFSSAKQALDAALKKKYEGVLFNRNYGWAGAGLMLFAGAFWLVAASVAAATDSAEIMMVGVVIGTFVAMALLWLAFHQSVAGKCLLIIAFFITMVVGFLVGMPVLGAALSSGWYLPLALPLLALPLVISSFWWISAPTKEGRLVLDHIAGFKQYLSITEGERLDRMTPPKDTPELFEKYLPFAIALGVENHWAERFAAVLAAASAQGHQGFAWYSGSSSPWSDPGGFVGDVGSSLASTISSASTAPGSSSGSGGGGSSGGGGGGGGGGGW